MNKGYFSIVSKDGSIITESHDRENAIVSAMEYYEAKLYDGPDTVGRRDVGVTVEHYNADGDLIKSEAVNLEFYVSDGGESDFDHHNTLNKAQTGVI